VIKKDIIMRVIKKIARKTRIFALIEVTAYQRSSVKINLENYPID
jgi:hypothetical protein